MHPTIESVVTTTIPVIATTVKGYREDWSDGDAIRFSSIKGSRSGPASTGEGRRSLICAAQALRAGNLDRGGSAPTTYLSACETHQQRRAHVAS